MMSKWDRILQKLTEYVIYGEENLEAKYQKEEIPKLDPKANSVYKVYKKLEKIEQDNYWKDDVEVFYKQAKFLENFEDDYEEKGETTDDYHIFGYNKTYLGFTFRDFRIYFSWRTKIRKGNFKNIDWEYQQIYINELLNKIGCKNAQDVINKLIEFWKGCRQFTSILDERMPDVIKEFYIINTIEEPYTEIVKRYPIKVKSYSQDLKDIKKGIYKDKLEFLNQISSYKIAKSKLGETDYGYTLNECTEKVFLKIHELLKQEGISLPDMLEHKDKTEHWWQPLRIYNIYMWEKKDKEIIIEGTEKYVCKKGNWNKTVYLPHYRYKNIVGYILKTMECYIREYLGYRKLKLPDFKQEVEKDIMQYCHSNKGRTMLLKMLNMNMEKVIYQEVLIYFKERKVPQLVFFKKKEKENDFDQEEKVEVIFNKNEFDNLRKKSEEIQKALIIEETEEIEKPKEVAKTFELPKVEEKTKDTQVENVYKVFVDNLTNDEKEIINILLNKQDIGNKMLQVAQKQNQMIEVMVSNINDKALENIGDTIIGADMSEIYEDYENEIKQVL